MMRSGWPCAVVLSLLGCQQARAPVAVPPSGDLRAPAEVAWIAAKPLQIGRETEIGLRVVRHAAGLVPLKLALQPPPEVAVLTGPLLQVVTSRAAGTLEFHWRVKLLAPPSRPLRAVVEWRTAAAGFHAAPQWPLDVTAGERAPSPGMRPGVIEQRLPVGQPLPLLPVRASSP